MEIFVECIIQIQAHEGFALHTERRLIFHRHTDIGAGIDDALIDDGDRTHSVIHGVVAILGERYATGRNHHRPAWHIHGIEANHIPR